MLKPYQPSRSQPWNWRRVVHLHRRAGFGANWAEIERDLEAGPEASIDRLIHPQAADEFEQLSQVIREAAVASGNIHRLKAWWIYRMLFSPAPLQERWTLLWHNHFATSHLKIDNIEMMMRQNAIFREFGSASFTMLFSKVMKDPAMLLWLDASSNRKEHPNENLARESMELFTLGAGNYSEQDVREAARALTGWSVHHRQMHFDKASHDAEEKNLFGRRGPWNGDDLVTMLAEHPATPRRLAFRICELLMGEGTATADVIESVAAVLREHDLNIGLAIERLLRSESFFADGNIGNRVLSPVELFAGVVRSLEMLAPPPSTLLMAEWTSRLGQDLFNPPNVFGWPGGRGWLTSRTTIGRANLATAIVDGRIRQPPMPTDASQLPKKYGMIQADEQKRFYAKLLIGDESCVPHFSSTRTLEEFLILLLASPELQIA